MPCLLLSLLLLGGALDEDPRFLEGMRRFEAFDLEGAHARFGHVLLDATLPDRERARVLVWRGLTEAELGRFEEAAASFEDAALLDEEAELPAEASPKVKAMLAAARERAAEREPPPAAEVVTTEEGGLHPRGPGVLIRTTAAGQMDPAVQDPAPGAEVPPPDAGAPWLLGAGVAGAALGGLALGGGGVLAAVALGGEGEARPLWAGAGVALVGGAALLVGGAAALGLWAVEGS